MTKNYILKINDADHKIIKIIAAQESTTMKELILKAIQYYIDNVVKAKKNE